MASSHTCPAEPTPRGAWSRLEAFLAERQRTTQPAADLEQFEAELHARFVEAEREALEEELARWDVDVPVVEIDGVTHRKVLRCEETYLAAAGPVRVVRSLYSTRAEGEPAVCPLELQAGIVEGRWTPRAAKLASWVVAHLTPQDGEELFRRMGGMAPSKSSLDRLPKKLSERWETDRPWFEASLQEAERVPVEATTLAVSIDGVRVPMKDGARAAKRAAAVAAGKQTKGPAGYQDAGCATLSFYDLEGERLSTLRLARMPESKKKTLKAMLCDEVVWALDQRPDLRVVKLADGAADNWSFLQHDLPAGTEGLDFYHAVEHLKAALQAAYGETHPKMHSQFQKLRHILLEEKGGVEKVIRGLAYLRDRYPRRRQIDKELRYFRKHRHRMRYAEMEKQGLPIGSGVVEAACKTLVTQRMKRSGMRWRRDGGQAILTLRCLVQSDRFDRGWSLLAATYKSPVRVPENVIPFTRRRAH
jgi:hypothetical protein